ncbi:MAG: helix-turn-helix domain-containing protein [Solirubrobacteraceae bacterium]
MARGASEGGGKDRTPAVYIRLSRAQVDEVVRAAGPESGILRLLQDLGAEPKLSVADLDNEPLLTDRRFSRSMLTGLLLLASFAPPGTERRVKDIATQFNMSQSTTHRFLKTLQVAGMLEQNPDTRLYRLARRQGEDAI